MRFVCVCVQKESETVNMHFLKDVVNRKYFIKILFFTAEITIYVRFTPNKWGK